MKNKMKSLLKEERKLNRNFWTTLNNTLKMSKSAKKANKEMMHEALTIDKDEYEAFYKKMSEKLDTIHHE